MLSLAALHPQLEWLRRQSGANWAFADQALVSGVNFSTGILLARALGPAQYGVFTIAWMILLFFSGLHFSLISLPMMSVGPKQREEDRSSYFGAVWVHQVIAAAICSVLTAFAAWCSEWFVPTWQTKTLALPLAAATFAFQIQDFTRRYFFSCSRAATAFLNDAISYLSQLFLLLLLLYSGTLSAATTLWAIAGTSALAVAAGFSVVGHLTWRSDIERQARLSHWNISKWSAASSVMQWTSGNLFILSAAAHLSPIAAGALRACQNLIGVSHVMFLAMDNFVPIHAARILHVEGINRFLRYLFRVALIGLFAVLIIAVTVAARPESWLKLLYNDQYDGYGYVVRWWAGIYIVVFLGVPLRAGLRALELTRPIFNAYAILTILCVLFSVPVVQRFGLPGALSGILVTQVILQGIMVLAIARRSLAPENPESDAMTRD